MANLTAHELKLRDFVRIPNCAKAWPYDQGGKSRFHPITKHRLETESDSPTPFVRVAYADAWGISLSDLEPYIVMKKYNMCHTRGCCNPLHWRVYPKPKFQSEVPRTPFWVTELLRGERKWIKDVL